MSDNMEREKNERLNARKIEEEKMKRELAGIGIYEPGITYNQMKEILGFLNESEDTSNIAFNNKNTQKGIQYSENECLSETKSDSNIPQENIELSRSSYQYKVNHALTVQTEHKTYSSSPEPPLYEIQNPMYRRKSSDSDELNEKQHDNTNLTTHSTNRFYSLRSGNCSQTIISESKTDMQDEVTQKLERWRLNPLDICIDENDVPLRQPCRRLAQERAPFGCCKEANTSEQRDQIAHIVSQHLKEMAKLQYTWHPSVNLIFQWGSPIQVGTANGSLDRKPLTDSKTEQVKEECTYGDNHERASKRKASILINNLNKESSSEEECDSQYDFAQIEKKNVQSNSKSSNIEHRAAYRTIYEKMLNVVAHQEHSLNDNNNDMNLEDDHIKSLHKRKADEENEQLSPELTVYLRKIVSPNPKTCLNFSRQRRGNISKLSPKIQRFDESKDVDQAKYQKKDTIMMDNEICRTLEEDWNREQEKKIIMPKDVEIRPSSITKEMRSLHRKKRLFNNMKTAKETRATTKKGESIRMQNKEKQLRVHEEKKKEEVLPRVDNKNGSWEQLLLDEENESSEMNRKSDIQNSKQPDNISTSSVRCPICNKLFSHNEIEDHAADCEQFETNYEGEDNDADQLECNICNNYKTSNGVAYEQHVHHCIQYKNNERHSHESKNIDSASTSSFKYYKPISEQKDSEIDYLGQFPSNSKTKIYNTGRKRKR